MNDFDGSVIVGVKPQSPTHKPKSEPGKKAGSMIKKRSMPVTSAVEFAERTFRRDRGQTWVVRGHPQTDGSPQDWPTEPDPSGFRWVDRAKVPERRGQIPDLVPGQGPPPRAAFPMVPEIKIEQGIIAPGSQKMGSLNHVGTVPPPSVADHQNRVRRFGRRQIPRAERDPVFRCELFVFVGQSKRPRRGRQRVPLARENKVRGTPRQIEHTPHGEKPKEKEHQE
jgi:hypothetical protein